MGSWKLRLLILSKIHLERYDINSHGDLSDYQLCDTTFTAHPREAIEDCLMESSRQPVIVLNENQIVGYFTLHFEGGPETYGYDSTKRVLLRALSIDDRYRRKGYSSQAMLLIFDFIEDVLGRVCDSLILAVNVANIPAQAMYEQLGFKRLREDFPGRFGNLIIMEKDND
ncbi:GNAT family N-acetyltransferase [Streptococcus hillyeri]|uniref:GNAT family N-acetyltransferase n=1 Tax=Streptococcus hillyeri TaxID=2282420 RepID=A0A3L9DUY0_9STRE|nr:GNAT family N-acetyltransferase [Streptococcus hillyeri]